MTKYIILCYVSENLYDKSNKPYIVKYKECGKDDSVKRLFDNLSDAKDLMQDFMDDITSKLSSYRIFFKSNVGLVIYDDIQRCYHVFDILSVEFKDENISNGYHLILKTISCQSDNVPNRYEVLSAVKYTDSVSILHKEVEKYILNEISNGYDVKYIKSEVSEYVLSSESENNLSIKIIL